MAGKANDLEIPEHCIKNKEGIQNTVQNSSIIQIHKQIEVLPFPIFLFWKSLRSILGSGFWSTLFPKGFRSYGIAGAAAAAPPGMLVPGDE